MTRDAADDSLAIDAPATARRDEVLPLTISGAPTDAAVSLRASLDDPNDVTWQSETEYVADENGVVDTTDLESDGLPPDVAAMRWLWSMAPEDDVTVVALANAAEVTINLEAAVDGRVATTTVTLRTETPGTSRQRVESDGVVGTLFEPTDAGPHPGVLVLHGSGGGPLTGPAALLAARGYAVLAVEYVGDADGISDELARVPVETVRRCADWLVDRSSVRDGDVGVVGWSRGGELALLAASRDDRLAPVVSYCGSGVAWDTPDGGDAWLADGDPVTAAPGPDVHGPDPTAFDAAYLDSLPDEAVDAATIPVERIDGPVLLISAGADRVWPSRALSRIVAERRAAADRPVTHLTYDEAGHYVTAPYLPKTDDLFGGTLPGRVRADADSWPVVLATLDETLRPSGA